MKILISIFSFICLGFQTAFASIDHDQKNNTVESRQTITRLREKIDQIDIDIQRLLDKRARIVLNIGNEKMKRSNPIKNIAREKSIIKRACQRNNGPLNDEAITNIFQLIIHTCRTLEYDVKDSKNGQ